MFERIKLFLAVTVGPILGFICYFGLILTSLYILYFTLFCWTPVSTMEELWYLHIAVAIDVACLGLYAGMKIFVMLHTMEK